MSYDHLALPYALLETLTFGRALQRARCAALAEVPIPERVLLLGDGDGRFLEQAVRTWPQAQFVSIDQSEGMLRRARERVASDRVRFERANVRDLAVLEEVIGADSFDLLVTHFFFDCLTTATLEKLVPTIARRLGRDGRWIVADFVRASWWQGALLWGMYRLFHNLTETEARSMPDYVRLLHDKGFQDTLVGAWRAGFIETRVFQRCS